MNTFMLIMVAVTVVASVVVPIVAWRDLAVMWRMGHRRPVWGLLVGLTLVLATAPIAARSLIVDRPFDAPPATSAPICR